MSKILLVDDEPRVLRSLTAALELDHDIITSESADQAIEAIQTKGPFDAIISDQLMPGQKGHEFLNWCQTNTPSSKRFMLTALPISSELKRQFTAHNDVTIFTKPWNLLDLKRALPETDSSNDSGKAQMIKSKGLDLTDSTELSAAPEVTILVFEQQPIYKKIYAQLQRERNLGLVFLDTLVDLLTYPQENQTIQSVVLDIDGESDAWYDVIKAVRKRFPNVDVLVTMPPKQARTLLKIESDFAKTKILTKPFSYSRLFKNALEFA